jgi:UDP-N-acetylmuramoylalanine--D-glutamate ligase
MEGKKILIMGLGLNGGGAASARYLAERGADVTVTDLRDENALAPSLEKLRDIKNIRFILGGHRIEDFEKADAVVKNPGARPDSPYLRKARCILTDISLFLDFLKEKTPSARLIAVTGSKGKSTTASAIHWVLKKARSAGLLKGAAYLGGNIAVSPLEFADKIAPEDDIVLELSSWQLGDLALVGEKGKKIKPRAAVITAILPDHLDRYGTMDAYVADKRAIYRGQDERDLTVASDDEWGRSFLSETKARKLIYAEKPLPYGVAGGWTAGFDAPAFARLTPDADAVEIVPENLLVPGFHQKKNLLAAGLVLLDLGLSAPFIAQNLGNFAGVEHRLEFFFEKNGVRFYNDTAATIPEAAVAAVDAFRGKSPVILVTGGTDKNLDFAPLCSAASRAKAVLLLAGTGSDKLKILFDRAGISAPIFDNLDEAALKSFEIAESGDVVILSPGCASFGMFQNEFDRGCKWKEAVQRLSDSFL